MNKQDCPDRSDCPLRGSSGDEREAASANLIGEVFAKWLDERKGEASRTAKDTVQQIAFKQDGPAKQDGSVNPLKVPDLPQLSIKADGTINPNDRSSADALRIGPNAQTESGLWHPERSVTRMSSAEISRLRLQLGNHPRPFAEPAVVSEFVETIMSRTEKWGTEAERHATKLTETQNALNTALQSLESQVLSDKTRLPIGTEYSAEALMKATENNIANRKIVDRYLECREAFALESKDLKIILDKRLAELQLGVNEFSAKNGLAAVKLERYGNIAGGDGAYRDGVVKLRSADLLHAKNGRLVEALYHEIGGHAYHDTQVLRLAADQLKIGKNPSREDIASVSERYRELTRHTASSVREDHWNKFLMETLRIRDGNNFSPAETTAATKIAESLSKNDGSVGIIMQESTSNFRIVSRALQSLGDNPGSAKRLIQQLAQFDPQGTMCVRLFGSKQPPNQVRELIDQYNTSKQGTGQFDEKNARAVLEKQLQQRLTNINLDRQSAYAQYMSPLHEQEGLLVENQARLFAKSRGALDDVARFVLPTEVAGPDLLPGQNEIGISHDYKTNTFKATGIPFNAQTANEIIGRIERADSAADATKILKGCTHPQDLTSEQTLRLLKVAREKFGTNQQKMNSAVLAGVADNIASLKTLGSDVGPLVKEFVKSIGNINSAEKQGEALLCLLGAVPKEGHEEAIIHFRNATEALKIAKAGLSANFAGFDTVHKANALAGLLALNNKAIPKHTDVILKAADRETLSMMERAKGDMKHFDGALKDFDEVLKLHCAKLPADAKPDAMKNAVRGLVNYAQKHDSFARSLTRILGTNIPASDTRLVDFLVMHFAGVSAEHRKELMRTILADAKQSHPMIGESVDAHLKSLNSALETHKNTAATLSALRPEFITRLDDSSLERLERALQRQLAATETGALQSTKDLVTSLLEKAYGTGSRETNDKRAALEKLFASTPEADRPYLVQVLKERESFLSMRGVRADLLKLALSIEPHTRAVSDRLEKFRPGQRIPLHISGNGSEGQAWGYLLRKTAGIGIDVAINGDGGRGLFLDNPQQQAEFRAELFRDGKLIPGMESRVASQVSSGLNVLDLAHIVAEGSVPEAVKAKVDQAIATMKSSGTQPEPFVGVQNAIDRTLVNTSELPQGRPTREATAQAMLDLSRKQSVHDQVLGRDMSGQQIAFMYDRLAQRVSMPELMSRAKDVNKQLTEKFGTAGMKDVVFISALKIDPINPSRIDDGSNLLATTIFKKANNYPEGKGTGPSFMSMGEVAAMSTHERAGKKFVILEDVIYSGGQAEKTLKIAEARLPGADLTFAALGTHAEGNSALKENAHRVVTPSAATFPVFESVRSAGTSLLTEVYGTKLTPIQKEAMGDVVRILSDRANHGEFASRIVTPFIVPNNNSTQLNQFFGDHLGIPAAHVHMESIPSNRYTQDLYSWAHGDRSIARSSSHSMPVPLDYKCITLGKTSMLLRPGAQAIEFGRSNFGADYKWISDKHRRMGVDADGKAYIIDGVINPEGTLRPSKNGTLVNDVKITPGVKTYLGDFDTIKIGDDVFRVVVQEPFKPQPLDRGTQEHALLQSNHFSRFHRVSGILSDGYLCAGKNAVHGPDGLPLNRLSREVIVVDRLNDPVLRRTIAEAKYLFGTFEPEQRAEHLNKWVRELMKPPNMNEVELNAWSMAMRSQLKGERIPLGDLIVEGKGVCRHQALLMKVLCDELGLKATLIRGSMHQNGDPTHAWVEIELPKEVRPRVYDSRNRINGAPYNSPQTAGMTPGSDLGAARGQIVPAEPLALTKAGSASNPGSVEVSVTPPLRLNTSRVSEPTQTARALDQATPSTANDSVRQSNEARTYTEMYKTAIVEDRAALDALERKQGPERNQMEVEQIKTLKERINTYELMHARVSNPQHADHASTVESVRSAIEASQKPTARAGPGAARGKLLALTHVAGLLMDQHQKLVKPAQRIPVHLPPTARAKPR